ncbi:NACHT domain-containing protein [Streptomyces anthocyanicus]|uniref:Uncharacterized protein n=1 Tax=Streptomyces violaceoruber TaxID=1935 RepID=A0ACD4WP91_STRVN|nr:hypothetical protein [Streptomyces sp. ME02-6979A]MDX3350028.1 hypothetical protein [Streptomyces sp. ME02-6979A]WOY99335.1 hypothetical protein R2E43_18490 [Streptomyces violaceoruber]BDD73501.1 hypothetical protein JCM4020_41210 [Streptomyces coelicolor]
MAKYLDSAQLWVSNSQIGGHNIQIGCAGGDVNVTIEAGPDSPQSTYPRSYIADQMIRECSERRAILRRASGVTQEQANLSKEFDCNDPDDLISLGSGKVVALVGPMGAGKSDVANLWLTNRCRDFAEDDGKPLPLWIAARNISSDLETWIASRIDSSTLAEMGISLVVDGIDETSNGAQLVEECQILVARWPKSQVMMTGRPGVFADHVECIHLESWSEDVAFEMIRKVAGSSNIYPHSFPPQIVEAVRRPLFAMLVVSLHSAHESVPQTSAGLIQHCALRSLRRSSGSWREFFPLLRRIAVSSVANDGNVALAEVGGEAIRHSLQETRLVAFSEHKVSFTLSLFEQWFAAEALLQGEVELDQIFSDLASFAKWRYVLALSLQTGSSEHIDDIMHVLTKWNPGAAAWVVREGIEWPFSNNQSSCELPGWKSVAARLHRAAASWCTGVGELTPVATVLDAGKNATDHLKLHLAVEENGKRFIYAWEQGSSGSKDIYHLSNPQELAGRGIGVGSSPAPAGDAWVWAWTLRHMRRHIEQRLPNALHLRAPLGGVIETEYMWAVIYALLRRGSFLRTEPVEVMELKALVRELQEKAREHGPVEDYAYQYGASKRITRLDLILVGEWLDRQHEGELTPPWPSINVSRPSSGWVWKFYTPERLHELTCFVYARALDAYAEMMSTLFRNFTFTLNHASLLPATLKGALHVGEGDSFTDGPVLDYCLIPLADTESSQNRVDIIIAQSREVRIPQEYEKYEPYLRRFHIDNPERAPFSFHGWTQTALHIWESRPATNIAFRWIWSDLRSLGLVKSLPRDLR